MGTVTDKLNYLQGTKTAIKDALVSKKVAVADTDTFRSYADKISSIKYKPKYVSFNGYTGTDLTDELNMLDTSNVTNMYEFFYECENLLNVNLSNLNTSKVTNFYGTFEKCTSLTNLDLTPLDTSSATNMEYIFRGCTSLKSLDLSNFNTSNVETMYSMFRECTALTSLDLSNFDTSKVTDTGKMFQGCSKLTSLIIDNPNVFRLTSTDALTSTPIASGTGYVYVPDNLVDTYKTTANWSTYANQIKGVSELGG